MLNLNSAIFKLISESSSSKLEEFCAAPSTFVLGQPHRLCLSFTILSYISSNRILRKLNMLMITRYCTSLKLLFVLFVLYYSSRSSSVDRVELYLVWKVVKQVKILTWAMHQKDSSADLGDDFKIHCPKLAHNQGCLH